ncbi:MAG: SDR family NAD(P)-dependent oxidoreductase [Saprospiraceae bacterium]|nr:SDR family NAD(P)-dependent oxidoreductase [Saprospiraceae bacterium]
MKKSNHKAVAIVGIGAVMPDATDLPTFWNNIKQAKYSISDVPADRWDANLYFDPDRNAPDKTYSKIGGWVKEDNWNPLKWRMPIPPKVSDQMDNTQKWAITAAREALMDFGIDEKDIDRDRTAVILGVAMGGDQHLYSATRIFYPEFEQIVANTSGFSGLPANVQKSMKQEMYAGMDNFFPGITEDTMPGELSNVVAGRIAALYNFHGPNYIADAACASAIAGITAAIEGLEEYDYDLVVTGGIDANMAPTTFVKFSKIGALSPTGTRPYAEGADGFIMGEGAAVFVLKRLEDAERDKDKIYAVIRSVGGSSDGKGKGITAPNPVGQVFAIKRAWEKVNISPKTVSLIEGHGTSTSVGDAVELRCLNEVFGGLGMGAGSVALGSVKSNIGHLKGAAGAAGIAKATMALYDKVLPPSLNFHKPNPGFDFANSPFKVNTELRPWDLNNGHPRRAGVSAFGFGGTNFHVVLEEYIPGKITSEEKTQMQVSMPVEETQEDKPIKNPLRGAFVSGSDSINNLITLLQDIKPKVEKGWTPEKRPPLKSDLEAPYRIAIDFKDAEELEERIGRAISGLQSNVKAVWKVLNAKGIFFGEGPAAKVAFLFTGQGSQYLNMLKNLRDVEPIVADTFNEANDVMTTLIGKPITDYIFFDTDDEEKIKEATIGLMQTEITQPAVLTVDVALYRLMRAYGIKPDAVAGHSLGEYGALVASGAVTFEQALRLVSSRGQEMSKVKVDDPGAMAAIFGTPDQINEVIEKIDGYVVIANINSYGQSVIGGETAAVKEAMKACQEAGYHIAQLPVSHAFHTKIVSPASEPLKRVLKRFKMSKPSIPIIANVTGDFYPSGGDVVNNMVDILSQQVASPVQFVKGVNRLYEEGIRVFIEMGPKKALNGFVRDITEDKDDVLNLFSNHPKVGDLESFNQSLCGLYAAGLGNGREADQVIPTQKQVIQKKVIPVAESIPVSQPAPPPSVFTGGGKDRYEKLGKLFVDFMDKANQVYSGDGGSHTVHDIFITGAALGLPKVDGVFDDGNVNRLLNGEQLISSIPQDIQRDMLAKNITRLVKTGKGGPRFETLADVDEVIKLAARKVNLDIARDFGFPQNMIAALDTTTELAIGAGIDALRDAGIPMVLKYKTTTTGSKLPDRWLLPKKMRDDTGVIFTSAFPGYNAYAKEMKGFFENRTKIEKISLLESIKKDLSTHNGNDQLVSNLNNRIAQIQADLDENAYSFNRRFLLRVLSMGHSQFAQYIGARGPNTQINAACASTTQAIGLAKDWIDGGRCKRVIIIAGDDITSDDTLAWFSSGFLAAGAAATDERVEDAALPFDKRRHGMIVGMGAVAVVVESGESANERSIHPICEVLSTVTANSAFHGTRLDVNHIKMVMEKLVVQAEERFGIDRREIAAQTVFVSHETYTPARGGSASAEINALRHVFGPDADKVVIANTKGMTGHAMAVGIEDVLAIKTLETGIVPPIPNFKEIDPELGVLNLSKGGSYPIKYALRLGAGFGSQISMSLLRWTPVAHKVRPKPDQLGFKYRIKDKDRWTEWLKGISGRTNPEIEVIKRTLRVADPMGDTRQDPGEMRTSVPEKQPIPQVKETPQPALVQSTPSPVVVDEVGAMIMQLISEKTGYPEDMLDPSLDLEADLGIDTVKQAELFAEIRGQYGIERDDNLQLSEFPTLNHIIQFVYDKKPDLKKEAKAPALAHKASEPAVEVTTSGTVDNVQASILKLVAEKTGYPEDMLDLSLDLEADLGIDTVKQAELFAEIRGEYGIERDDNLQLSEFPTLEHIIQFVYDKKPELKQAVPVSTPVQEIQADTAEPVNIPPSNGASTVQGGDVQASILKLVAEKTGYPEDMLDLDLDLEADLGIDTVKQAELFAEIRGEYGIERDDNLQLSEFPTLKHIIQFVYDKKPELADSVGSPEPIPVTTPQVTPEPVKSSSSNGTVVATSSVQSRILGLVAEKTGYPEDMLELELDLEADLGIDTVKQAELFAEVRGEYGIERDDNLQLSEFPTLKHIIQFVHDKRPDLAEVAVEETPVSAPIAEEPVSVTKTATVVGGDVQKMVLNLVAEKTGYPMEMLELDLDLEADLGIDTVKQAELFAEIRGQYDIERDDNLQLSEFPTLKHIIQFVHDRRPDQDQSSPNGEAALTSAPQQEQVPEADDVKEKVLSLVAEKTGYPKDMLDLELDLEADLGIDTVKQAELFAEIRGEYGIERDDNLQLSEFPTLNHIIQFVYDRRSTTGTTSSNGVAAGKPIKVNLPKGDIEAVGQLPRRVPIPRLRPDITQCKTSGVDLAKDDHVLVMMDEGRIGKPLVAALKKKGVQVHVLNKITSQDKLIKEVQKWTKEFKVAGVYWLPALDQEGDISKLTHKEWKDASYLRVKMLYTLMRELNLQDQTDAFLVSATRMGGQFGYDDKGSLSSLGGAVCGFTKAYKREHPEVQVKVVDFEVSRKTTALAKQLIEETLYDPGVVEVGYKGGFRWTIGLEEKPLTEGEKGMELNSDSVFLVTGAAGSITSAITADLAEASGGTFHLLDLAPAPDKNDPELGLFATDQEGLKRKIFERLGKTEERVTPVLVNKELARIERAYNALQACNAVEEAGGTVHYYSMDLRDHKAVAKAISGILKVSDKIDVLVHAAGLEISRLLKDKSPSEFDLVFDVKADGWFNILSALGETPIGASVVFSSIAGRFGNGGQTDYSAANDFLCKSTSGFKNTRNETRGIALDWTAWAEIGMAARGSIPMIMKQAGIDMLSPSIGIPFIRKELTSSNSGAEIVVAQSLGMMMEEFNETGGLDTEKVNIWVKDAKNLMVERVNGMGLYSGLTTRSGFDPKEQGFLYDHEINGTPVLPGVMGVEAMVSAAKVLFPDRHVITVDNVEFYAPFKFYRSEPRDVFVEVQYDLDKNDVIAYCTLIGKRRLLGQDTEEVKVHFKAKVRLAEKPLDKPKAKKAKLTPRKGSKVVESGEIYEVYFHGPAYQVIDKGWKVKDDLVGLYSSKLPPNHSPDDMNLNTLPRLLELGFQTAGIMEMGMKNQMGLPSSINHLRIYEDDEKGRKLYAVVKQRNEDYDISVVNDKGETLLEVEGYGTAVFMTDMDENKVAPLKAATT